MQNGSFINKLALLVFSVSLITGCLSSPSASRNSTVSASVEYRLQASPGNFGAPATGMSGKYSGVYYCNNQAISFVLDLKASVDGSLSGMIRRSPLLSGGGNPAANSVSESRINGHYDEASSTLNFRLLTMNDQPHNVYYNRMATLEGVILPDASAFVMYDTHPAGRTCSAWIAQRGEGFPDEWDVVRKEAEPNKRPGMFSGYTLRRERTEDQKKNTCDPKLLGWLKEAEKIPGQQLQLQNHYIRNLYRDRYFVPHFGKPFLRLDTEERMVYNIRLTGSCNRHLRVQQDISRDATYRANALIDSFASQSAIADADKTISLLGFDISDDWLRLGRAHFAYMADHQDNPDRGIAFLTSSEFMLKRMLPEERETFEQYANVKIRTMIIPELSRRLDKEFSGLNPTFASLNTLAGFEERSKKQYPQVDTVELKELVSRAGIRVNQSAFRAAEQYARSARNMEGIYALDGWRQRYPQLAAMLDSQNDDRIDSLFAQRRQQIVADILRKTRLAFQQDVIQAGMTTAALVASARYEADFGQQYAPLSGEAGFADFARERWATRDRLLAATAAQLEKLFHQARHERTLRQVREKYLLPDDRDLPAGRTLYAAYDKRLKQVAPFGEGKFETYLNALYTYDYDRLREIDRHSAAPVAAALNDMMPAMQGIGGIVEAISGGMVPARKMLDIEQKKLKHMSLIYPIMAFYILNYEKYNAACVESNAKPMTVQYRWTEYENDGGIRRVVDSGGHDTTYLVNRRFLPAFMVIYKNDADDIVAKFADRFFAGDNKIYRDELIDGTYRLMQNDCRKKTIRTIEPQMIRYFNDVKKRMDAVTHF